MPNNDHFGNRANLSAMVATQISYLNNIELCLFLFG
jgi:hypothetical protein